MRRRSPGSTGLSDATVGYYLSLLDLDDDARKQVRDGRIPVGEAIAAVRRVSRPPARDAAAGRGRGRCGSPITWTRATRWPAKPTRCATPASTRMRRRLGKVACGECWETVIREDERLVTRTLRVVPDAAAAVGP